jgi:serine-type D-Ala-D-Ala carboxypeptidase/endopeptidase
MWLSFSVFPAQANGLRFFRARIAAFNCGVTAAAAQTLCLRFMRTVIRLLIGAALSYGAAAAAQEGPALPQSARDFLARAAGSWPLVVAGQIVHSDSDISVSGAAADGAGAEARFVFGEAGSTYAGLLLADLASAGRLRLDDPISRYLPEGLHCADPRVCAITLQQLATQESGLPPRPANLFPVNPEQPWREYREADLLEFLANYRLPENPPARESALGQLLLGWILGRVDGEGYTAALSRRIGAPLGLAATGGDDTNLLPGHSDTVQRMPQPAPQLALPLQLRSNAADPLKLLRAMLRPGDSPLRAALLLSRQPRDARGNWGLGWRISRVREQDQEWPLVWQYGNSGGYASFIGFRIDRQQGVVLLGNADASLAPLGLSLLGQGKAPPLPPLAAAAPAAMAEYAGLYESSPGQQLLVRAGAGSLSAQASGGLASRLRYLGDDVFDIPGLATQLHFQRDTRGQIELLRWMENGVIVPVRRLSSRAPQLPRTPMPAADMSGYCGDFAVDADVLLRLHCQARPAAQFSGGPWRELTLFAPDRFAAADSEFELIAQRDPAGAVEALSLVLLGVETRLPRVRWQALPATVAATLQREQQQATQLRAAREQPATPSVADKSAQIAPWNETLQWLPKPQPIIAAKPSTRPVSPKPSTQSAVPTAASRVKPATVKSVAPGAPASVEALPEREPRHRFVPQGKEKSAKEKSDDGT